MSDSDNARTVPADTAQAIQDIEADIGHLMLEAVESLFQVEQGLTVFLSVAADNDSEFATTAHWMVRQIDGDFTYAKSLISRCQGALRAKSWLPSKTNADEAEAAAERLRVFAEALPVNGLPQEAVDGAAFDLHIESTARRDPAEA